MSYARNACLKIGKKKLHPKMELRIQEETSYKEGIAAKVEGGGTTLCAAFLEARYAQKAQLAQMLIAHIRYAFYAWL